MQLESQFSVPRESLDKLRQYEALLIKWQKAVNLVGPATIPDAWDRHFMDSIQLTPMLPDDARTLYDLGSGAGFPGLVMAITRPGLKVTLIESDQKKCAFLTTVSRESKTPVTIVAERIESVAANLPAPDVVTARALAPLSELFGYIYPWVQANPDLVCIFPKGQLAASEQAVARELWTFDSRETASLTDPRASILVITGISRKAL